MSAGQRAAAGRRWVAPVVYGVLGVELALVVVFAATYNALDFRIYMWGGHAVLHDNRLYLTLAYGHWFTYSPFAAIVYVPIAAIPLAVARVLWDLASVAALAYTVAIVLKLAGYRPSRVAVAGVTAAALPLDPFYQTLYLGQINLILLALILTDVWRVSRGSRGVTVGTGVGIAAAIKLTPAIFIVFFLLAGRTKAALVAAGTFVACGLAGFLIAPGASKLYWRHLFFDTHRVGAPYISNQSPYAAAAARPTSAPGGSSYPSRSPLSAWPRPPSWPEGRTGWARPPSPGSPGCLFRRSPGRTTGCGSCPRWSCWCGTGTGSPRPPGTCCSRWRRSGSPHTRPGRASTASTGC